MFTKDELAQIVRKAMAELEIADQGEEFVQTVAAIMWRKMVKMKHEEE